MKIKIVDYAYSIPRVYYKDPFDYEWFIQFREMPQDYVTIRLAI